jgi:glycosyltransferase involved in cell wall biosynthesis
MTMDLSVVVATRDRAKFLPPMLESLRKIESRLRWEVIFVDNASQDKTGEVLQEFLNSSRISVRVVREPQPGAGRARNTGWRAASAAIISFIDDDCYPTPNLIDEVHQCFVRKEVGFIGGRILLHDPTDLRITIQESTEPRTWPPGSFIAAGALQGANWAVRRTALENVGGFDPNLGAGTPFACEEVELQARLSAGGWTGAYNPRPLVYHHHRRRSPEDLSALKRSYDVGRGAYYAKCLLDPRLRWRYAKRWASTMLPGPLTRVARELVGAGHYLWLRARGRLEVLAVIEAVGLHGLPTGVEGAVRR